MEFLTRYWTQIRAQLEQLSVSQRWLIAVTLVVLLLAGFLLIQYAGQAETTAITPFSSANGQQVLARLRAAGIDAEREAGQIVVPVNQRDKAIALMMQDDLLSEDTSKAFKDLVKNQTPWSTSEQDSRRYLIAKQEVLSRVLEKMEGVGAANVVIDRPQERGFGETHVKPSASVSVAMSSGGRVSDDRVEAIAGLVSGAVAEMTPQNVKIIDANHGEQHTVDDPAEAQPGELRQFVRQQERYYKQKLSQTLSNIPNAIVAVTVRTSNVSRKSQLSRQFEDSAAVKEEQTEEVTRRNIQEGGEPGARSNTGLTIDGGGGGGTLEETTDEQVVYQPKNMLQETSTQYTGHQTTQINATIRLPRSYFVDLYKQNNPNAQGEPTDQDLQPLLDEHLAQIEQSVSPLIESENPGQVNVTMYPDPEAPKKTAMAGPGGGGLSLVNSGWVKTAAMVGLALLSLGLMLGMVRKATKQQELPSVEELAGEPPSVSGEEEVVGEASEAEGGMAGFELDESQMRSRKVAEQISDMIKNDPSEAGALLSKWVDTDD
jgi:flagellar M-ring protein FliF